MTWNISSASSDSFPVRLKQSVMAQSPVRSQVCYWEVTTLHSLNRWNMLPPLKKCGKPLLLVQLAAFWGPSGMRDMKKVMMKDHVEDKNPGAAAALLGSSAPSSNVSPSSSEPSSTAPSCTGLENVAYSHINMKDVKSDPCLTDWRSSHSCFVKRSDPKSRFFSS